MKDMRPGEQLWEEWLGSGYYLEKQDGIVYYTFDHIDTENDLVRRALASALQRDGVAISLAEGFKLVDSGLVTKGWVGILEEEIDFILCDEYGATEYGDTVENIQPTVWIEI